MKLIPNTLLMAGLVAASLLPLACSDANSPPAIQGLTTANTRVPMTSVTNITCNASDPDGDALSYSWSATGGIITSRGAEAEWTSPDTPGLYEVNVTVTGTKNSAATGRLTMSVMDNLAPIIDELRVDPSAVGRGKSGYVVCRAHDPEGEQISYRWEASEGQITGEGASVKWTAACQNDVATIKVTVTDKRGASASLVSAVTVLDNHAPFITSLAAEPRAIFQKKSSNIDCLATDPDGDDLRYTWTASGGEIKSVGSQATWTAPEECGKFTITVLVEDGRGAGVTKDVSVNVVKEGG